MLNANYQEVLEREIVLTRLIDFPQDAVFAAFTSQAALEQWFGPAGFTTKTLEFNFRVGGFWRFEFKGPDGTIYLNRIEYVEITPSDRIAFYHGEDKDNDPNRFFVTITFDAQHNQKTVVTLRQLHPTNKRRKDVIGFGAVEFGMQTMDKLAVYLNKIGIK